MNIKRLYFLFLLSFHFIITSAQWAPQNSGTSGFLNDICFHDSLNGWIAAGNNGILLTQNGGNTWNLVEVPTYYPLQGVDFIDLENGWAVSYEGTIIHSENGGENWDAQDTGGSADDLFDVEFIDLNNGWAVGGGTIMHTNNGGALWSQQLDSPGNWFVSVSMVGMYGWAAGTRNFEQSIIYKTTDSGQHWSEFYVNSLFNGINDIEFLDTNNGWFVGEHGLIMHSSDGGNTWTDQSCTTEVPLEDIEFLDTLHGWTVGGREYGSIILVTEDGGASWQEQYRNYGKNLIGLAFSDLDNGWAVGYPGFILHTENGGLVGVNKMNDEWTDLKVHAYPNPFKGSIKIINLPDNGQYTLSIFDIHNKLVKESTVYNKAEISLNDVDSGIYLMTINIDGKRIAEKIIKVR